MRKSILIVEYNRLREISDSLDRNCPVCPASEKLKKRHKTTDCAHGDRLTACHKNVQKRCHRIMELTSELDSELDDALEEVKTEMYQNFEMGRYELSDQYLIWRKKRSEYYD